MISLYLLYCVYPVYALYEKSIRYTAIAAMALLLEITASIVTDALSIPASLNDGACMVVNTPLVVLCMLVGLAVSQTVLIYLTYRKNLLLGVAGVRMTILRIVTRDGVVVFGAMIGGCFPGCEWSISSTTHRSRHDVSVEPGH